MSLFEIITIFYDSLWSFCLLLEFDEDTSLVLSFFLFSLTIFPHTVCSFYSWMFQALRHLYVLAAEPRLLIPVDVDTGRLCQVHVSVR